MIKCMGFLFLPRKVRQILGLTYGNNQSQNEKQWFCDKKESVVS